MNQFVEYANDEHSEITLESWLANDRQDATDTLGEDIVAAISEVIEVE